MRTRPPAVAGTFYPARPDALRAAVDEAFAGAAPAPAAGEEGTPKALIAPHAGYVYSGPVAASAYARVRDRHEISRVVLLGPSHRVPLRGVAVPDADGFDTPLGTVPLERADLPVDDAPHALEHSLEVHVPFLQAALGEFTLLAIVVGHAGADEVAAVIDAHWGGPETLVVVSTDLSHYHDQATAGRLDRRTAAAIVRRDPVGIGEHDACGCRPLRGLLEVARRREQDVRLLDLRNSGDTAGPRDRVVGYGAFAVG